MPLRSLHVGLFAIVFACLMIVIVGGLQSSSTGLTRTLSSENGYTRTETRWPWLHFDGATFTWDDFLNTVDTVTYEGTVWFGEPGPVTWAISHQGSVTLAVDGEVVYAAGQADTRTRSMVTFEVNEPDAFVALTYTDFPLEPTAEVNIELAVYERGPLGRWQLIPAHRLYDAPSDSSQASRNRDIYRVTTAAYGVLCLILAGLLLNLGWRLRKNRLAWAIAGLVTLAFALRMWLLLDRAANDTFFYTLIHGSDNYVLFARQTLAGNNQIAGSAFSPGNTIWLTIVSKLLGPQLWTLYTVNALMGALSVIPAVLAGRLLANRRAGLLAGLLIVIFPPLVFYHTTLQIAALNASLITWLFWIGLDLLQKPSYAKASLMGMLLGALTIIRPTSAFIGVALVIAWMSQRDHTLNHRFRRAVQYGGIVAACAFLIIAAQFFANRTVGSDAIISEGMPNALLWGNNHIGDGSDSKGDIVWLLMAYRGDSPVETVINEFRNHPRRLFELQLHKLGLFWSNQDIGNNVNYQWQGLDASTWLNTLALNGQLGTTALLFLSLVTLMSGLPNRADMRHFLIGTLVLLTLSTVAFTVFGRMRSQIWPLLAITSAVGIVQLFTLERLPRKLLAVVLAVGILLLVRYFETDMPGKQFVDDLPPDAIAVDHAFNDDIRLVGFDRPETDNQPEGYLYFNLYWQVTQPHDEDKVRYIHLIDPDNGRMTGEDNFIGHMTAQPRGTTHWQTGDILREPYLFAIPEDAPDVIAVNVGTYDGTVTEIMRLGMASSDDLRPAAIEDAAYRLGEALYLSNIAFVDTVPSGQAFEIAVTWAASAPVHEDFVWFVHLLDDAGEVVAQSDGHRLNGHWTTSALVPGYALDAARSIPLETVEPGEYTVTMGLYRRASLERVSAWDTHGDRLPDDLIRLGTVTLAGG